MTLKQINKQVEKLENKVSKLRNDFCKNPTTKKELELMKQKEILNHLEKIQYLIKL